ncbi:PaaI family thioesterase, partial [Corallococcus exiguus]|uniref:PaaI family thioesterase n=1 Tax=Corallococcus exiguus TaxID=83462 RepID=UPI00149406E3
DRSQAQLDRFAELFTQSLTMRHFGARMSFPEGRMVVVELPEVQPQHRGGLGASAVNGGVLSALFDFAIGCTPALRDPTRRCATVQLSMSFERPATGNHLRVEAVIFNALIIVALIPLALKGVRYRPLGAAALLR